MHGLEDMEEQISYALPINGSMIYKFPILFDFAAEKTRTEIIAVGCTKIFFPGVSRKRPFLFHAGRTQTLPTLFQAPNFPKKHAPNRPGLGEESFDRRDGGRSGTIFLLQLWSCNLRDRDLLQQKLWLGIESQN